MHTTHSNTQYKNESSTVKWAQWDKTQSRELTVCSYVCASHCAQLLHTILHRTDLIVFPLTLQTITTSPMMSIWGKGGRDSERSSPITRDLLSMFQHFATWRFQPSASIKSLLLTCLTVAAANDNASSQLLNCCHMYKLVSVLATVKTAVCSIIGDQAGNWHVNCQHSSTFLFSFWMLIAD